VTDEDAIQAARAHAREIAASLDARALRSFTGLWERLADAEERGGPKARFAARDALAAFLEENLDWSHPVRRALASDTGMLYRTPAEPRVERADLRDIVADLEALVAFQASPPALQVRPGVDLAGPAAVPDGLESRPDAAVPDLAQAAHAALLAHPSRTVEHVEQDGVDPFAPDLIRLAGEDGVPRLPAFQFGADGQPLPVVLTINGLLGADDDPWGVAAWWLDPHAWLRAAPADRLADIPAGDLVELATAELEEE